MNIISKLTLCVAATVGSLTATAAPTDSISYIPQVHGTLRGRLEVSTVESSYRFQLRNARVSIGGNIAPWADYFVQADFCDRGSIKFLDGWARIRPFKGFSFQAGQFRMPFGVAPFRGPHTYYFANRSFIGKQICNYRAVGAKAAYTLPSTPLTVEAGVFNPGKIGDHTPWNKSLAFAGKATYKTGNMSFSAGYMSISPDSARTQLADGAVTWTSGRWMVEGEYMYKHYNRDRHRDAHAYNIIGNYAMPIKAGIFNRLSFQGRFDGMTDHSTSVRDKSGNLISDNPACNRVTGGVTLSYVRTKNMFVDIRANYEKYFYHRDVRPTAENGDKLTVELVVRF